MNQSEPPTPKEAYAAIDLGSNSFHMLVAEEREGQLIIIDRIREMVRLAEGLDEQLNLSEVVEQRALDCLQRFGERIRDLSIINVSAVGTNTLRRTRNSEQFLDRAQLALGFPIEIISGIEEARLIYQGVAHSLEQDHRHRLVIDIGGGSTELILGEDFSTRQLESLEMGCVTMTRRYFSDGVITADRIKNARVHVLQKMRAIRHGYRNQGWDVVIGASGTIKAARSVIRELELDGGEGITAKGLKALIKKLAEFKTMDEVALPGLSERRAPVFLGGVIVLQGVFDALSIDAMAVSDGALREGLLYDMYGRLHDSDIRNKSAVWLASRFHTDTDHAALVEHTALALMQQVKDAWAIQPAHATAMLKWACKLHEVGRDISHSGYQKHTGYIIEHADLYGFSRQQQKRLAVLARLHRGKIHQSSLNQVNEQWRGTIIKLMVLLRLAVIFHRSRVAHRKLPEMDLKAGDNKLRIKLPAEWLERHPLTLDDLNQEAGYLQAIDFQLKIKTVSDSGGA